MKYRILILALTTAGTAQAQTLSLRGADSLWAKNYATNDTITAMKLMAPDFAMTASNGRFKGRSQELADVRPAAGLTLHYFRTRDVIAEEAGNTGVVSGTAEWAFTANGRRSETVRAYNAVYRKGGDLGWELVALYMRTAPASSSLAPLKWIEGSWIGSGGGLRENFFERYKLQNDTTLVIESFGDSTFTRVTDTSQYESRRGFVTNVGKNYVAQIVTADSIVFVPLTSRNGFVWKRSPNNPNQWFATIRPLNGNERTYTMTRR